MAGDSSSKAITPFKVEFSDDQLTDLRYRLGRTKWSRKEAVEGRAQGVPLNEMLWLVSIWKDSYDWRKVERLLNTWPQFRTNLLNVNIHFTHVRSKHANATPLLLMHGWPGSILEFRHVIEPLTDPTKHGGKEADAFHLVIPSLPGYGFSDAPTSDDPLWTFERIVKAFHELMVRLEYKQYVVQGGDWGADLAAEFGRQAPEGLLSAHANTAFLDITKELDGQKPKNANEQKALDLDIQWKTQENGYFIQQATRPQTLGYGLSDSPTGLLAWIYEKIYAWAQDSRATLTDEEILDNITLYWLTNSITSSMGTYYANKKDSTDVPTKLPMGQTLMPGDTNWATKEWVERYWPNLVYFHEAERGGHYAAWEEPEIFVNEIRAWMCKVREFYDQR